MGGWLDIKEVVTEYRPIDNGSPWELVFANGSTSLMFRRSVGKHTIIMRVESERNDEILYSVTFEPGSAAPHKISSREELEKVLTGFDHAFGFMAVTLPEPVQSNDEFLCNGLVHKIFDNEGSFLLDFGSRVNIQESATEFRTVTSPYMDSLEEAQPMGGTWPKRLMYLAASGRVPGVDLVFADDKCYLLSMRNDGSVLSASCWEKFRECLKGTGMNEEDAVEASMDFGGSDDSSKSFFHVVCVPLYENKFRSVRNLRDSHLCDLCHYLTAGYGYCNDSFSTDESGMEVEAVMQYPPTQTHMVLHFVPRCLRSRAEDAGKPLPVLPADEVILNMTREGDYYSNAELTYSLAPTHPLVKFRRDLGRSDDIESAASELHAIGEDENAEEKTDECPGQDDVDVSVIEQGDDENSERDSDRRSSARHVSLGDLEDAGVISTLNASNDSHPSNGTVPSSDDDAVRKVTLREHSPTNEVNDDFLLDFAVPERQDSSDASDDHDSADPQHKGDRLSSTLPLLELRKDRESEGRMNKTFAGVEEEHTLLVTVVKAKVCPRLNKGRPPHSFCTLTLGNQNPFKTRTIWGTEEPRWDQSHIFKHKGSLESLKLMVIQASTWDWEGFNTNSSLADFVIPLSNLVEGSCISRQCESMDTSNLGDCGLYVRMTVDPQCGEHDRTIQVLNETVSANSLHSLSCSYNMSRKEQQQIMEAPKVLSLVIDQGRNMQTFDGLSNNANGSHDGMSYCMVRVGKKIRRTCSVRATANPIWDDKLVFPVESLDSDELVVSVFHMDKLVGEIRVPVANIDDSSDKDDDSCIDQWYPVMEKLQIFEMGGDQDSDDSGSTCMTSRSEWVESEGAIHVRMTTLSPDSVDDTSLYSSVRPSIALSPRSKEPEPTSEEESAAPTMRPPGSPSRRPRLGRGAWSASPEPVAHPEEVEAQPRAHSEEVKLVTPESDRVRSRVADSPPDPLNVAVMDLSGAIDGAGTGQQSPSSWCTSEQLSPTSMMSVEESPVTPLQESGMTTPSTGGRTRSRLSEMISMSMDENVIASAKAKHAAEQNVEENGSRDEAVDEATRSLPRRKKTKARTPPTDTLKDGSDSNEERSPLSNVTNVIVNRRKAGLLKQESQQDFMNLFRNRDSGNGQSQLRASHPQSSVEEGSMRSQLKVKSATDKVSGRLGVPGRERRSLSALADIQWPEESHKRSRSKEKKEKKRRSAIAVIENDSDHIPGVTAAPQKLRQNVIDLIGPGEDNNTLKRRSRSADRQIVDSMDAPTRAGAQPVLKQKSRSRSAVPVRSSAPAALPKMGGGMPAPQQQTPQLLGEIPPPLKLTKTSKYSKIDDFPSIPTGTVHNTADAVLIPGKEERKRRSSSRQSSLDPLKCTSPVDKLMGSERGTSTANGLRSSHEKLDKAADHVERLKKTYLDSKRKARSTRNPVLQSIV